MDRMVRVAALIRSMKVCDWLGAHCMGHTAWVAKFSATFILTRSEWVIDANSSTLSPENRILSTPVSQIRKSHAAKGSPYFAEIGYTSRPTPLEYMVDTS